MILPSVAKNISIVALLAICVIFFSQASMATDPPEPVDKLEYGNQQLLLTAPPGFVRLERNVDNTELWKAIDLFVPSGQELLAFYVPRPELEKLTSNEGFAGFSAYAAVLADSNYSYSSLQEEDFVGLQAETEQGINQQMASPEFRREMQERKEQINQELSKDKLSLSLDASSGLSVYHTDPQNLSFSGITDQHLRSPKGLEGNKVLLSTSMLLLKDKLVFANVYMTLIEEKDLKLLQRIGKTWSGLLVSINPPVSGEPSIWLIAILGGIVLLGAFFFLRSWMSAE